MTAPINLRKLADYFEPDDIGWKPIAVSKKTGKGLAAAYVTNRAIMDRLDDVCGPENWKNEYRPGPDGGVICGLSVRVGDEWVTKWDGSQNTDVEAVKGGLSTSMRRAAVQWGIGRYLYRLGTQWVPVDERGQFKKPPSIPPAFLPRNIPSRQATPAPSPTQKTPSSQPQPAAPSKRPASNGRRPKNPTSTNNGSGVEDFMMPR